MFGVEEDLLLLDDSELNLNLRVSSRKNTIE
jgi:hypothetical protein